MAGQITVAGRAFPDLMLAPLAGITDLPFRLACRRHGCRLAWTEMVSARGLVARNGESGRLLATVPEDRPLAVQLFGSDPEFMAEAARLAVELVAPDLIDINMGCPVRKVVRAGSGGGLMSRPGTAEAIVAAVRRAVDLPLSVKFRTGPKPGVETAPEFACRMAAAGADMVIVHGRSVAQGFTGSADWGPIGRTVAACPVPVIGNGDVRGSDDAARMRGETGCAGVMIGRAALGRPWLFSSTGTVPGTEPSNAGLRNCIDGHYRAQISLYGEENGTIRFRKILAWYARGVPGAREFRRQGVRTSTADDVAGLLDEFLPQ